MAMGTRWSMAQKNTFQPCLAASSILGIMSRKAVRNRYPKTPDQTIDETMPRGTDTLACMVSSEVWAEAS